MKWQTFALFMVFGLILAGCNGEKKSTDHPPQLHEEGQHSDDLQKDPINRVEFEGEMIKKVNGEWFLFSQYFNQLKTVGQEKVIQNPENTLVLVNKEFSLPSDYKPNDLVKVNVPVVYESAEENYMRKEAADALKQMFDDAKAQNIHLYALSGYRSYQTQQLIFDRQVNQDGYEKAILVVAKPGTSEHQTGLTMDITAESVNFDTDESFEKTKEGIWLKENAHKYGFILRYPKGKESITQYSYEPWHFRYVGKEIATVIYENDWTFEEFFGIVKEM